MVLEESGENNDNISEYLDPTKIRRKLEYWCGEGGDVKDEQFLYIIARFLENYAPELLKEFRYIPNVKQSAQAISDFVSWMPNSELRVKTIEDQIEGRRQIRPGLYKRYHHNLNTVNKTVFGTAFGYFVSISDIGESDFYLCNFFSLLPPFVAIATRYSGFVFHKSPNKIILMRSLITDNTSPMQIDVAHLEYHITSEPIYYVNIDKELNDVYEATIVHHAYIGIPCNAVMQVGENNHFDAYDIPIMNWRFDHLIRFNDEKVQAIADAVKWDI